MCIPAPPRILFDALLTVYQVTFSGFAMILHMIKWEVPRPFTLLEDLSDRLVALHLSDRVREYVDHVIPGDGFIDWESLCGLIRNTGYGGPVTLEVLTEHSRVKEKKEFLRLAFEQAARLYNLAFA